MTRIKLGSPHHLDSQSCKLNRSEHGIISTFSYASAMHEASLPSVIQIVDTGAGGGLRPLDPGALRSALARRRREVHPVLGHHTAPSTSRGRLGAC